MEPLHEALRLIKRQAELEAAMRRRGGIRVTEERELFQLRSQFRTVGMPGLRTEIRAKAHEFKLPQSHDGVVLVVGVTHPDERCPH